MKIYSIIVRVSIYIYAIPAGYIGCSVTPSFEKLPRDSSAVARFYISLDLFLSLYIRMYESRACVRSFIHALVYVFRKNAAIL